MALRPIFTPLLGSKLGVEERLFDFKWHAGMAVTQKQKSIRELHTVAKSAGIFPILEISSKSETPLGVALSAFNLCITTKLRNQRFTVETAFQGSKVFQGGGPFKDLIGLDSRAAKKDIRLKESGNLIGFEFYGKAFPLMPWTFFYDWIYINALNQNEEQAKQTLIYGGFSDIEFNPERSINCQAYSAALYLSLVKNNLLSEALESPERFLEITGHQYRSQKRNVAVQSNML